MDFRVNFNVELVLAHLSSCSDDSTTFQNRITRFHCACTCSPRSKFITTDFLPEIGYAQGMNDILARFLVVTDSEVDSYWMFCSYMEKKKVDFLEDTMLCKISMLVIFVLLVNTV